MIHLSGIDFPVEVSLVSVTVSSQWKNQGFSLKGQYRSVRHCSWKKQKLIIFTTVTVTMGSILAPPLTIFSLRNPRWFHCLLHALNKWLIDGRNEQLLVCWQQTVWDKFIIRCFKVEKQSANCSLRWNTQKERCASISSYAMVELELFYINTSTAICFAKTISGQDSSSFFPPKLFSAGLLQ